MEFSEHIRTANVENVVLRQPFHPPTKGTLCITGHHLLFSDRESQSCRQVLLLLRNIDAIEKSVETLWGYSGHFSSTLRKERLGIRVCGDVVFACPATVADTFNRPMVRFVCYHVITCFHYRCCNPFSLSP